VHRRWAGLLHRVLWIVLWVWLMRTHGRLYRVVQDCWVGVNVWGYAKDARDTALVAAHAYCMSADAVYACLYVC
jgi:hypothetical protein